MAPSSKVEQSSVFVEFAERMTKNKRHLKVPSLPKRENYFGRNSTMIRIDSEHDNDPNTFANAIGSILLIAQFFGLLPISGIRSSSPNKFEFSKTSWRTLPTYAVIIGSSVMSIMYLVYLAKTFQTDLFRIQGGIADGTMGVIFYGNTFLGAILYLRLSPRWISLQHDWRAMEQAIDRYQEERPKLKWKFALMAGIILFLVLIEHLLTLVAFTTPDEWSDSTFDQFLEIYTLNSHPFLLKNVNYSFTLGIFCFILYKFATFTWNFTDLFIMLVSTGLAERYKQMNQRIANNLTEQFSPAEWKEFRENYAILSTIVKQVDREISPMILLSFVNNIYFICLHLIHALSIPSDGRIISTIYFFGSFAFLIGRTMAVILLASRINDQSKVVLPFLYNCPSSTYTSEVSGGIVTFGIVLLQFDLALQK